MMMNTAVDFFSIVTNYLRTNFTAILDHIGTFAFAVSGIRLASAKKFDLFGAFVVGFVTAIGGGTTRDLFLHKSPFWMEQPSYLIVTGIALIAVIFGSKKLVRLKNTLFLFDAIGLGLFVVVGIDKAVDAGYAWWVAIIMGTITGSIGGVIRDVFINEMPLIFRGDIYAMACVLGGVIFFVCQYYGLSNVLTNTIAAISVIVIRVLAVKYHIQLPILKGEEDS